MNASSKIGNRIRATAWAVAQKTREIGVKATLAHVVKKVLSSARRRPSFDSFDERYGTDTAGIVGTYALGIPKEMWATASRYETVSDEFLKRGLSELPIDPRQFVFVDLGAGKGKTLLLASLFPFKQIIGVELSSGLTEIMRNNLKVFNHPEQLCRNFSAICQDVRQYDFPNCDLVLYLYNPFDLTLMRNVVERVEALIQRHRRRVYVVYQHPVHRAAWEQSSLFRVFAEHDRSVTFVAQH